MMELDDLKSAWNKISSENEKKLQLSENDIQNLIGKRTLDISEKIGRNIRIGIWIILAWVILGFIIELILTPILDNYLDKPYLTDKFMFWSYMIEVFTYALIFIAFLILWIRYHQTVKTKFSSYELKPRIVQLIKILDTYKIMFYIILIIIIIYVIASFCSGFFMEYNYQAKQTGIDFRNLNATGWIIIFFGFLFTLGIFITVYYLLFNLFFKRLYGRYLDQLKSTLKELEETGSVQ